MYQLHMRYCSCSSTVFLKVCIIDMIVVDMIVSIVFIIDMIVVDMIVSIVFIIIA